MIRRDLDAIPAYVPGKTDPEALKLSSNEVAGQPLPSAVTAMARAAAGLNRYPDMGAVELRRALARHLGVEPDNVAVGCGSSALCQQLAQATSQPGTNIVFPWRSFEAYPIFCHVAGAEPRPVPVLDSGEHDLESMLASIDDETSLVFLCSPNNPTGSVISRAEFDNLMERVPEHVTVALDEAYFEFNRDPDAVNGQEVWRDHPNVLCLRTFSKAYGLAGVRVGYGFGNEELVSAVNKVGVPFQVSAVAQAGALASLASVDELLARTEDTVEVRDEVADHVGAAHSQANFVWIPADKLAELLNTDLVKRGKTGQEPAVSTGPAASAAAEVADRLAARGVLTRAFPEGLRVTVTNREEAEEFCSAWDAINL